MDEQADKICWGVTLKAMIGFALIAAMVYTLGIA